MSAPIVALFNGRGDGTTFLVYHLAWMYADLGLTVLAADLDPQSSLTAALLDEDRLEALWSEEGSLQTLFGTGVDLPLEPVSDRLSLLAGDPALAAFEDDLADVWLRSLRGDAPALAATSCFWRLLRRASEDQGADLVLIDLGPGLGPLNRAALLAADHIVFPLKPDWLSLQALRSAGPALRSWRSGWAERLDRVPNPGLELPDGRLRPVGYVVRQSTVRLDRPVEALGRWPDRIPGVYRTAVLGEPKESLETARDTLCLAILKSYPSLIPLAAEAKKPLFHLKPADGAMGSTVEAVQSAYTDFRGFAGNLAWRIGLSVPT